MSFLWVYTEGFHVTSGIFMADGRTGETEQAVGIFDQMGR